MACCYCRRKSAAPPLSNADTQISPASTITVHNGCIVKRIGDAAAFDAPKVERSMAHDPSPVEADPFSRSALC
jgi:hypothetical protein